MTHNPRPAIRMPLHNWHMEHGAQFADRNGRQLPGHYGSVESEVTAAREAIGLVDISTSAKLRVDGHGVRGFASAFAADGSFAKPGEVAKLHFNEPVLACRLTERSLFLTSFETDPTLLVERFSSLPDTLATDLTMALAAFAILGPRIEPLLRRLTALDLSISSLPAGRCAETNLAGIHALLLRPPGHSVTETLICVATDLAEYTWETFFQVGCDLGITAVGLECLEILRVTP